MSAYSNDQNKIKRTAASVEEELAVVGGKLWSIEAKVKELQNKECKLRSEFARLLYFLRRLEEEEEKQQAIEEGLDTERFAQIQVEC